MFGKENKSEIAEIKLRELLENGKLPQNEIMEIMKEENISKRTIDEVKKKIGIKSLKISDKWYWELPQSED